MDIPKKRNLYLIGAGEFGREVESWISMDNDFISKWKIIGFLDNNLNALDNFPSDFKVLGIPATYNFLKDDAVIICVANPKIKKRIAEGIFNRVDIISYLSNKSIISKFVKTGIGVIVCPNAIISTNTILDNFVTVNIGSQIGHDCSVGKFSSLMTNVDLGGHVKLGENVFMGSNSTIIPNISISSNITVGTGSIVARNLKTEGTYFGNPASLLKY